jgi:hypothetical protein
MHCPKCGTEAGWDESWDGEDEEVWRTIECRCGVELEDFCECEDPDCGKKKSE